MKQVQEVLTQVPGALRRKGVSHVLRAGTKYIRGRLPEELWLRVDLCIDPMGEADETISLFDSGSIEVNYKDSKPLPRQLDAYNRRITSPEGKVYLFKDVSLVGSNPLVGIDDRYFSASWFGVDTPFFTNQVNEMKRNLPLSLQLEGNRSGSSFPAHLDSGFLLLTERGVGFHHWFYEVLPKLWWYEALKEHTGSSPKIVSHSPLEDYHVRSLELMGYSMDEVVQHPYRRSEVSRLYVVPHPIRLKGNQLQALPFQLKWVGNRIKSSVRKGSSRFGSRVYVSRQDADRRRVVNEDELMEELSGFGFERFEPGRLSLKDQIRLFSNADIIVGPHGKAYTNLIYAEDSTLIELFPRNGATETYFVATEELDLNYEFLECQPSNREVNIRPRDRDFRVPIAELTDIIGEYI